MEYRTVSIEEGEAKAKELNALFMETSAKAGFNIKALFRKVASSLPEFEMASQNAKQNECKIYLFRKLRPTLTDEANLIVIDVKLTPQANATEQPASWCSC